MDDLPDAQSLNRMSPTELVRLLAQIDVQEAKVRAELAKHEAELREASLHLGLLLISPEGGQVTWKGKPTECLLAERPEVDLEELEDAIDDEGDAEFEEDDSHDGGPWPVNVEVDLLARMREENFDLGGLLKKHYIRQRREESRVFVTPSSLSSKERIIVMTVGDAGGKTYVFSANRRC